MISYTIDYVQSVVVVVVVMVYLQVGATQGQKFATSDVMSREGGAVFFEVKVTKPQTDLISRPITD